MRKTSGATVRKVDRTDTETRTARAETKDVKTGSTGDTDIAMHTTRARRRGDETGQETQGMDTTTGISKAAMDEMMDTASMRATNSAGSTGSMASRVGMKAARLSRAEQLCDR